MHSNALESMTTMQKQLETDIERIAGLSNIKLVGRYGQYYTATSGTTKLVTILLSTMMSRGNGAIAP